jgi:CubicO group peptidase (beta-lactamase class C family)
MDMQVNKKGLELLFQFFNTTKQIEPVIPQKVQKPIFIETKIKQTFDRATPESVGISSNDVAEFFQRLNKDDELDMHGAIIIKNGKIIGEGTFGAYKKNIWHITHSECKSITGLAIGLLVDDKLIKLDDRIIDILNEESNGISKLSHRSIKVEDLLTMRSGVSFAELGAAVETEWIENFFESTPSLDVGKKFNYNSMNSYILSAIVKKVSGENMTELLKKRIFTPLGIENFFWEKSPEKIEKGGWGLYILPEDLAKIGQLVLNKGSWNGKQLISEKWILDSTKKQVDTSEKMGKYNYGYQIWVGEKNNTFLFNGMFGQNLIGDFEKNLLVVVNAGNDSMFQESPVFNYYDEIFNSKSMKKNELPKNKKAYAKLIKTLINIKKQPQIAKKTVLEKMMFIKKKESFFNKQKGIIWELDSKKMGTISVLPFCVQVIQNNYTKGMEELWIEEIDKKKYLVIKETDEIYKIPFNFDKYEYTNISFHGEVYQLGISSRIAQNENGCTVLILHLAFLEIANTREIKIIFINEKKIKIEFTESPGKKIIQKSIESMKDILKKKPFLNSLDGPITDDFISFFVDNLIAPKVMAIKKDPKI